MSSDVQPTAAAHADVRAASVAWRTDVLIALVLCILGYAVGRATLRSFLGAGGQQAFYQSEFSPAVAFACGRGYVRLQLDQSDSLRAFLLQRVERFDCRDLPATVATGPLTAFEAISRYLQLTAGLAWQVQGVSWRSLDVVLGVAYGLVAALAYGLFRLGFGPLLSVLGALAIVFSPANLGNLPHLRDYAKAPFLLALLLVSGLLVRRARGPGAAAGLSAAAGAILGVGLGFRNDLLLAIVPLAVTIALLCPVRHPRAIVARAAMLACFAASFALAGAPILRAYARASNTPHVALLGLMTPFDAGLGIRRAIYEVGYVYNDPYAALLVRGVVERERAVGAFGPGTSDYDPATAAYLRRIATTFPADLAVRAYAAVARLFDTPFIGESSAATWLPAPIYHPTRVRVGLSRRAGWLVYLGAVAGIGVLLARRTRAGLWLLLIAAFFGGSGAVQYQARHVFYLEVFHVASMLAGCWILAEGVREVAARRRGRGVVRARAVVAPAVAIALVAGSLLGVLWALRAVQTPRVRDLLHAYQAAPAEPLATVAAAAGPGRVRVAIPPRVSADWPRVMSLLVVEFGGARCDAPVVQVRFRYDFADPYYDYTRNLEVPITRGRTTSVIFHAFDLPAAGVDFAGLELPEDLARCLAGIRRITDDSGITVPLVAVLPAGWETLPLYQRMSLSR